MYIPPISNSLNFTGIQKKVVHTMDGVLTKYLSKGKEVGSHFVSNKGFIVGERIFSDGVKVNYSSASCNLDGKKYYSVFLSANGKFESNPNLFQKRYSLTDEFVKKHPKLFTRKGIELFAFDRSKSEIAGQKIAATLGL